MTETAKAPEGKSKADLKAEAKAARDATRDVANGVTRPKAGTQTGKVWTISDDVSKSTGKPAERKDVLARTTAEGINEATAATQYGKWRKYHGLKSEPRPPKAAAPTGSDVSTQASPA